MGLSEEAAMETSAEAWTVLAGLLDHGPLAVVWHDRTEGDLVNFDTVIERKGSVISARTYRQEKRNNWSCRTDAWTRERSSVTHWPFLDTVLDYLQVQQRVTA